MSLLSSSRFIDLTHVITENMPTWIEGQGFSQKQIYFANVDGYAIHKLNFEKAGIGTHFDSAAHFFEGKRTVRTIISFYQTLINYFDLVRYMSIQLKN
jgi:kynurenine formamidase